MSLCEEESGIKLKGRSDLDDVVRSTTMAPAQRRVPAHSEQVRREQEPARRGQHGALRSQLPGAQPLEVALGMEPPRRHTAGDARRMSARATT